MAKRKRSGERCPVGATASRFLGKRKGVTGQDELMTRKRVNVQKRAKGKPSNEKEKV